MAAISNRTRRTFLPEAREKGTKTRHQRSVFNRYLLGLQGKRILNIKAKIAEIGKALEEGTKQRRVPKFVGGKRTGTQMKNVPFLPAVRARLLARRRDLIASIPTTGKAELRAEFLAILPECAASQGWDREILLEVGVPEVDLDEAGIE